MVPFLLALVLAPPTAGGPISSNRMMFLDPRQGPMPVNSLFMIPARVPDCVDRYQAQRAAEERIKGFEPECMLPPKTDAPARPQ